MLSFTKSGSPSFTQEYDLEAHVLEKNPGVSSSVLDPGDKQLGEWDRWRGK